MKISGMTPIRRYADLRDIATSFAQGKFPLLVIVGDPGNGKSSTFDRAMESELGPANLRWGSFKSRMTPWNLYQGLYKFALRPIKFDDIDSLWEYKENIALTKAAGDSVPVKTIEWHSDNAQIKKGLIPKRFKSISNVCFIVNTNIVQSQRKHLDAIFDRACNYHFLPSAIEIHREVARGGWFPPEQEDIFDFIGQHLYLVPQPSLRMYINAGIKKEAGRDWCKEFITANIERANQKLVLVAKLLADPSYPSEQARIEAFDRMGGGSRAQYFRYKNQLLELRGHFDPNEVGNIRLGPYCLDQYTKQQLREAEALRQAAAEDADLLIADGEDDIDELNE